MGELHIKHVDEKVSGGTTVPEDPLSKQFKKSFDKIEVENLKLWQWPYDNFLVNIATNVLDWAEKHLRVENLVETTIVCELVVC